MDGKRDNHGQPTRKIEPKFAHDVVIKLVEGNERKKHCIVTNHFFQVEIFLRN